MVSSIPNGWTDYKRIGKRIEGTRFIAFKVPLREHISKNVDTDHRLDREILLKMVPNLGLIIDLTNTYKYYDPRIFEIEGVDYRKLMVPGHETPRRYLADKFIRIVKEFMENNKDNDKLIGVHCTHGVNRTGYMICNYMISQMNVEPKVAMNRFAKCRGHKIQRENYIKALENLTETNSKNWRERGEPDMQQDNGREKRDHTSDRERYKSWRRSPRSNYSCKSRKDDRAPYRLPSSRIDIKAPPTIPNEEQLSISEPSLYIPPHLRLDHNNTTPNPSPYILPNLMLDHNNATPNPSPYISPNLRLDHNNTTPNPSPYIPPNLTLDHNNTMPNDETT